MIADWVMMSAATGMGIACAILIVASHVREQRWHKQQQQRMKMDRPPLAAVDFLHAVRVEPGDGPTWLAVRRTMAASVGLPPEAIHPADRLADLWRMQSLGPDLMDQIYRRERALRIKVARSFVAEFENGLLYRRDGSFQDFGAALVEALRQP